MSYARARRHYRVAEKEAEQSSIDGLFIPTEQKSKIIVIAITLGIVLFLQGLVIGIMAANSED